MTRSDALGRALPVVVAAIAAGSTAAMAASSVTRFPALESPAASTIFWIAIAVLVVATAAAGVFTRDPSLAILLAACTVCRVAPVWVGWEVGAQPIRTVAAALAPLLAMALVAITLTKPSGRLDLPRWLIVAFAVTAALSVAATVLRDPFRDLTCWTDCTAPRAAWPWPAGEAASWLALQAALGGFAVIALVVAAGAVSRMARSAASGRLFIGAVTVPAALATTAAAVATIVIPHGPVDRAALAVSIALDLLLTALAIGVVVVAIDAVRRRRMLTRLATLLGDAPEPAKLGATLGAIIGAPVHVIYPLADGGEPMIPEGGASTITLRRGTQSVAILEVPGSVADVAGLVERIGSAATAAIDNGRLQAEDTARLSELADSRRRIVDATDRARRDLERDLHDGSQAQLVALLLHLGLARSEAEDAGLDSDAAMIAELAVGVERTLGRLRDLSHGVYPAVVEQLGLEGALRGLLAGRPGHYRLTIDAEHSEGPAAAQAAYRIAAAAITAMPPEATADVKTRTSSGSLHLRIEPIDVAPSIDIEDRMGAIGGTIGQSGEGWEAVIPCGS